MYARLLITLACLPLVLAASCPEYYPYAEIIAGEGNNLFYFWPISLEEQEAGRATVFRLDLVSGERTALVNNVASFPREAASDGKHIAWIDWGARQLAVYDIATGETSRHYQGLKDAVFEDDFSIVGVDSGWVLVIHVTGRTGWNYGDFSYGLSALDIASGNEQAIDAPGFTGWNYSFKAAIADNRVIYLTKTDESRTATSLVWSPPGNGIEAIDLSTGANTTIASDVTVLSYVPYVGGNTVIWEESADALDPLHSTLRAYDFDTQQTRTIVEEFAAGASAYSSLLDFDGMHLLVIHTDNGSTSLQLIDLQGQSETIATHNRPANFTDAMIVGSRVTWIDATTDEFVIYDTADGSTRRFPTLTETETGAEAAGE